MASLQEVQDSVVALVTEVVTVIEAESAQIQVLIEQIGNGGVVTSADLDALKADLDAARQNLAARVSAIYEPAPPVEG